jgi:hypothetical protein
MCTDNAVGSCNLCSASPHLVRFGRHAPNWVSPACCNKCLVVTAWVAGATMALLTAPSCTWLCDWTAPWQPCRLLVQLVSAVAHCTPHFIMAARLFTAWWLLCTVAVATPKLSGRSPVDRPCAAEPNEGVQQYHGAPVVSFLWHMDHLKGCMAVIATQLCGQSNAVCTSTKKQRASGQVSALGPTAAFWTGSQVATLHTGVLCCTVCCCGTSMGLCP